MKDKIYNLELRDHLLAGLDGAPKLLDPVDVEGLYCTVLYCTVPVDEEGLVDPAAALGPSILLQTLAPEHQNCVVDRCRVERDEHTKHF